MQDYSGNYLKNKELDLFIPQNLPNLNVTASSSNANLFDGSIK